ncbi:F-box domain containing protein, partial [Tanacetum coccineum]
MNGLPSNIIFDIFSRVPAKCLARSRCVSKLWCNYIDDRYLLIIHDQRVKEPTPILCHSHYSRDRSTRSLCFHIIESKQTGTGTTDCTCKPKLEPKEDPFLEFLRKKPLSKSSDVQIEFRGSCNGLMCLSQDEDKAVTSLVVVHPLKKECYELPPLPKRFVDPLFQQSCGLGFDASTNTLKMVCVLSKKFVHPDNPPDLVRENLCTLVHVFGTNSWKEIPQVPFYPIEGKSVFANGCLHWLVSILDFKSEYGGPVIWFDVEKEEFGMIDPPNGKCDLGRIMGCGYNHLVDLNGEVGFVFLRTLEVWVLKQKEWVPLCRIGKRLEPGYY